jgi:ADP-ribose pyrophosphatase
MKNNTASKPKILSSKNVFQSKFFRVIRAEIERNGKRFTKDLLERNDTVVILPITNSGEIYMIMQYRDSYGKSFIELPAGNMEHNDSPLESAKRELNEETGLTANNWQHIATFITSANIKGLVHVFTASDLEKGQQALEEDEEIKILKVPINEAIRKIETGEIQATAFVSALLLFDKLRKEGKI